MRVIDVAMLFALVVLILFWVELELHSLDRRFPAAPDRLESLSAERYYSLSRLSAGDLKNLARDFKQVSLVIQVIISQSPRERHRLAYPLVIHQMLFLCGLWIVELRLRTDATPLVRRYDRLLSLAKAARARRDR